MGFSEKAKAGRREYMRRYRAKKREERTRIDNAFYERKFDEYQAEAKAEPEQARAGA